MKKSENMKIKYGNILTNVDSGFIVHGCNAQGVMGSGIAKSIKDMYPEVYQAYLDQHRHGYYIDLPYNEPYHVDELELGTIIPVRVSDTLVVINAITQRYYSGHRKSSGGREVDYEAVAKSFEMINSIAPSFPDIEPVLSFPKIGAGLGGGDWDIISTIIKKSTPALELNLWVLE